MDALPHAKEQFNLYELRLCNPDPDSEEEAALIRDARALAKKEWVRKQVEVSEGQLRTFVPHYPESLGLELTPNCNFTCGHCSSHGTPELHQEHNRMPPEKSEQEYHFSYGAHTGSV